MSNKAEPLLYGRSGSPPDPLRVPLWRSAGSIDEAPEQLESSSRGSEVVPLVEASHGWLVRFLTHEEDYYYLHEEQEQHLDRFIGRGSYHHHDQDADDVVSSGGPGAALDRMGRRGSLSRAGSGRRLSTKQPVGYEAPSASQ